MSLCLLGVCVVCVCECSVYVVHAILHGEAECVSCTQKNRIVEKRIDVTADYWIEADRRR